MEHSLVDYRRVLQPQPDGYDSALFLDLKTASGFARRELPEMPRKLDGKVPVGGWRPQRFRDEVPSACAHHYDLLEQTGRHAAPVHLYMIGQLLDVLTAIECHDGVEKSSLCPTARYPGAWIVLTSISDDPAMALRGIMHELMHQKLIALGFGSHTSFLDTDQRFIRNDREQLHHSIVNSYADTMQPYMPGPIGRPMAACIHGYASFLAAADVTLHCMLGDPRPSAASLAFVHKWSARLEVSLAAIERGVQATAAGRQLVDGLAQWTAQHLRNYRALLGQSASRPCQYA